MVLTSHGSGNKTRQTEHGINSCHETNNDCIIVICRAVRELVGWMVDKTKRGTKDA